MVTLEQLDALDLVYWMRSGVSAARACYCDESSLSRRLGNVLKIFDLTLDRKTFEICGDQTLLNLQRAVHQHARLKGARPVRIDATHLIRHHLVTCLPSDFLLGPCDHTGLERICRLLQSRVLDAWITSDIYDLPDHDDLEVMPLWRWPHLLVVHRCHPLVGQRQLTAAELRKFPSLILPAHLYPALSEALHAKGFGHKTQMKRYDKGSWSTPSDDAMTIVYGSCLSLDAEPELVALPWDLGLIGGEALVYRHDCKIYPWFASLLSALKQLQAVLLERHPSLVPLL